MSWPSTWTAARARSWQTRFYELAERFDQAVITACHNEPLATTIADRRGQTARLRGIAHADPRGMERSLEEHRRICRAVLDGDPDAAARELAHHLAEILRTIIDGLTRNAGPHRRAGHRDPAAVRVNTG